MNRNLLSFSLTNCSICLMADLTRSSFTLCRSSQTTTKESNSCNSASSMVIPSSLKNLLITTNLSQSKSSRTLSINLVLPAPGFPTTINLSVVLSASCTSLISSRSTYLISGLPPEISLTTSFKSEVIKNCLDSASFILLRSSVIPSKYLSTFFTASFVMIPRVFNSMSPVTTNSLNVPSFLIAFSQNNS